MRIEILSEVPPEFANAKPLRTYETQYIYTGFRRYDVERKMLMEFVETIEGTVLKEVPLEPGVFSRGYSAETVVVSVYSETPRIWKEYLNPHATHFFREKQPQ
jgi:hypothetical protein